MQHVSWRKNFPFTAGSYQADWLTYTAVKGKAKHMKDSNMTIKCGGERAGADNGRCFLCYYDGLRLLYVCTCNVETLTGGRCTSLMLVHGRMQKVMRHSYLWIVIARIGKVHHSGPSSTARRGDQVAEGSSAA